MATHQTTRENPVAPAAAAKVIVGPVAGTKMRGIVDGWDSEDGYGFVCPPKEVDYPALLKRHQVEAAGLLDILQDGMTLEFDMVEYKNGPIAGNLRLVEPPQ